MNAAMKQIFECCGIAGSGVAGHPAVLPRRTYGNQERCLSARRGSIKHEDMELCPSVVVYCFSFGASSAPSNLRQASPANQRL